MMISRIEHVVDELFFLDANVLIEADDLFYPFDRIPQFWNLIRRMAMAGCVKMPPQVFREVGAEKFTFDQWLKSSDIQKYLIWHESINRRVLKKVLDEGYVNPTNTTIRRRKAAQPKRKTGPLDGPELKKIKADPYLIATAYQYGGRATVVTRETSAPSKERANRRIPDVCEALKVRCISDHDFCFERLDFSIPGQIEYGNIVHRGALPLI